ncbi:MAG: UDP-N-acetylmuramoyl-L-alanine--D-glutamate ligase [Oscillospiraceae bacterium]|nr:UDP-N-acetylmuramoyl-L-alanine--D-glutamate ligase [Oscillospiraceae bacterium]
MLEDKNRMLRLLEGKRILFVGLGVSHISITGHLAGAGLDITVCDRRPPTELDSATLDELRGKGVNLLLGEDYPLRFEGDVLFRTPGMYFFSEELNDFRAQGGIVTSEMELFCEFCPCPILAVTGSDGKTTTTTLIAELLLAQGQTVHLGGNIGRAMLGQLEHVKPTDLAVLELSSFQLISMRCAPQVSVVTNMSPNHLDVHKDMPEYIHAKKNIYAHQNAFSTTVLGADNEITASMVPEVRGRCETFSLKDRVKRGAYLRADGMLCRVDGDAETPIVHRDEIRLPGEHNILNLLAAICAAGDRVSPETVAEVARTFNGVEHRIELVREFGGVKWYNDSIATSPTRAMAGLASFPQKIILIAGGYDKNLSYDPLAPALCESVKLLILIGATADKIETTLRGYAGYKDGAPIILRAQDMAGAVALAHEHARHGDIVSLSPASASFDHYRNFEERGRHFKGLVGALDN